MPELANNVCPGVKGHEGDTSFYCFVDMNMPIMDGCSFLNVASKNFQSVKFDCSQRIRQL